MDPILGVASGKAVVGSRLFDPILGVASGKAVVGSGLFDPILGVALGKAVVGSGVFDPMLGTVCGGGGQPCAINAFGWSAKIAMAAVSHTSTFAHTVMSRLPV